MLANSWLLALAKSVGSPVVKVMAGYSAVLPPESAIFHETGFPLLSSVKEPVAWPPSLNAMSFSVQVTSAEAVPWRHKVNNARAGRGWNFLRDSDRRDSLRTIYWGTFSLVYLNSGMGILLFLGGRHAEWLGGEIEENS